MKRGGKKKSLFVAPFTEREKDTNPPTLQKKTSKKDGEKDKSI